MLVAAVVAVGCGRESRLSTTEEAMSLARRSRHPAVIGGLEISRNENVSLGYPHMTQGDAEVLISRKQYVLSWNKDRRVLNWSAWRLEAGDIGATGRSNNFEPDQDLKAYLAQTDAGEPVDPLDFRGSCFDRGHQVPSGDRTAAVPDNQQTFLMSNMIPQTAYLNRVIWEHLEAYARSLVLQPSGGALYQFAGTVFSDHAAAIGPHQDIDVPTKNFKIIVQMPPSSHAQARPSMPRVLAAVMMPNRTSKGTDPVEDHSQACDDAQSFGAPGPGDAVAGDWRQYEVSLEQIEAEAHIDFSFLQP